MERRGIEAIPEVLNRAQARSRLRAAKRRTVRPRDSRDAESPEPAHEPRDSGRAPWAGIMALAVLAAGITVAALLRRDVGPAPPRGDSPAPLAAEIDTGDAVIDQALGQIPVDSTELRNRWVEEVPGVEVSDLSPEQREIFVRFANAERCTCGCGFTLAACRRYDATCPVSLPRVEALLDSVRAGKIRSVVGLRERPVPDGHPGP